MKVALLGDVGLFGKFSLSETNLDLKKYFEDIAAKLGECDVVIGNLETPFAELNDSAYGYKSAHIKSSPDNIEILKYLNVTHVNLANNHIYDFGQRSYDLTKSMLDQAGIEYFGIESKVALVEAEEKIALSGFCNFDTNPVKANFAKDIGVNALDVDTVVETMSNYDKAGYLNIVSFHSGIEHVNYPSFNDIKFARKLATNCPYVYYGHHPHVIQPVEEFAGSTIAYSLGNFCFSDVYTSKSSEPLVKQSENNNEGLVVILTIEDQQVINTELVSTYVGENKLELNRKDKLKKIDEYIANFNKQDFDTQSGIDQYISTRDKVISNYYADRKSKRDLNWYLKRLNINSAFQLCCLKLNSMRYNKLFVSKLK